MANAYDDRMELEGMRQTIVPSIGKILRRYRKDDVTQLLNTMMKACVEKQFDALLWDTIAENLGELAPRMTAADLGLALACLQKADYRRDVELITGLLHQLTSRAASSSSSVPSSGGGDSNSVVASRAATASGGASSSAGRKRRRAQASGGLASLADSDPAAAKAAAAAAPPSSASLGSASGLARRRRSLVVFSEHALCTGLAAAQHWGLGRACSADINKLCVQVQRSLPAISNKTLCRLAHHAAGIAASRREDTASQTCAASSGLRTKAGGGAAAALLREMRPTLCSRLLAAEPSAAAPGSGEWEPGDLCLLAHAYAQAGPGDEGKSLFDALEPHFHEVALLQLSAGQLSGLANSFAKFNHAEDLGFVRLFDVLGRQLVTSGEEIGLRNASVALNAFAQASVCHEPLFQCMEQLLPAWLPDSECDMRQLAMLAHAHVRVGLNNSSLLPLIWDRARRLAKRSDPQALSLMLFAVTKAAAVGTSAGSALVATLGRRLQALLEDRGRSTVAAPTLGVIAYALARSGCAETVEPGLWKAMARNAASEGGLSQLSLSEAANLATAFVEVYRSAPHIVASAEEEVDLLFTALVQRVSAELPRLSFGRSRKAPARPGEAPAAAKLVAAFGEFRRFDAAPVALDLARRCIASGAQAQLNTSLLRGIAQALSRLRVHDEDLIQALVEIQMPRAVRRRGPGLQRQLR